MNEKQWNEKCVGNGAEKMGMKLPSKAVTVGGEEVAEGLSELRSRMHW